ncbi:hypothetical protein OIE71_31370 [Streptomyces sp. NBC_01725]|uniref:hypothetical protein n=1 Tax=Streptomyces sp. NBC_01725 TaxID=2975923 RepID=UPI002E2C5927|nr:hypothetical protein [Streptomyces sp. NBC_01725]
MGGRLTVRSPLRSALTAGRSAGAAVWRSVWLPMWRRCSGRTPTGRRRHTAPFLFSRMLLLPALALTVLALAGTAYLDLHGRTEQLRERYAPAMVELAHARTSLELAHREATLRLGEDGREPLIQTDLVGLGEKYPSLLTEAAQSLNNAAQTKALRAEQEQEVRVVSGLVVAYDDWIGWADTHHDSRALRTAGLDYAASLLHDGGDTPEPTAVVDRIEALEDELNADASELSGWTALSAVTASGALLAVLVFVFAVVGTIDFVLAQLRVRSPLLTLYALPVLLALGVLVLGAAGQQHAQRKVSQAGVELATVNSTALADPRIEMLDRTLAAELRGTHPGGWALAAELALAVGAAGAVASGFTLFHYGRRHLRILWRTP